MLRRELHLDVQMTEGHYGEFTVLVDGEEVASGGPLAFLGVPLWHMVYYKGRVAA